MQHTFTPRRLVVDDMLTPSECRSLETLVREHAVTGDGYTAGKPSPHSPDERFAGLTVNRVARLTVTGATDGEVLRLVLGATGRVKAYVERVFGLDPLYFAFTHLVRRSAIAGCDTNSTQKFSHAIHADNCNLRSDGGCDRTSPAYVWRDYSAIMYLNDDFTGGEFVFAKDHKGEIIEKIVEPKCGRVVAFSSGNENIHGVRAVTSGSRFAIGLWFTFNPDYAEVDRTIAYELLH